MKGLMIYLKFGTIILQKFDHIMVLVVYCICKWLFMKKNEEMH